MFVLQCGLFKRHMKGDGCFMCDSMCSYLFVAFHLYFYGQARLRRSQSGRVVVVGGSYAGVELSCNLATELGRKAPEDLKVTLVTNSEVRSSGLD